VKVSRIPFNVYDFFGYLASGFLVLAAFDLVFTGGSVIRSDMQLLPGLFWLVVAYVTGHIVANTSSFFLERLLVQRLLGRPHQVLFEASSPRNWTRLFPGYYEPLPKETRERVLKKADESAAITQSGPGLFLHCFAFVRGDEDARGRLDNFLSLYGFSRNVATAAAIAVLVLAAGLVSMDSVEVARRSVEFRWAVAAAIAAVGLLYRYLKFFRLFSVEVFARYAELEPSTSAGSN
jgi:hypothetical protein